MPKTENSSDNLVFRSTGNESTESAESTESTEFLTIFQKIEKVAQTISANKQVKLNA